MKIWHAKQKSQTVNMTKTNVIMTSQSSAENRKVYKDVEWNNLDKGPLDSNILPQLQYILNYKVALEFNFLAYQIRWICDNNLIAVF